MAKFKLAIVKQGNEALWRNYWVNSGSEGSAAAAPSGLGLAEVLEAQSLEEAIEEVQRQHPDCTVMLAGGEHRIG